MRAAVDDKAYAELRACGKQGFNLHNLLFTTAHAQSASICSGLGVADVQAAMAIAGAIARSAAIVGVGAGAFVVAMVVPTNSDQRTTATGTASDGAQATFGGTGSETGRTMTVHLGNGEELRFTFTQTGSGQTILTGASRTGADGATHSLGAEEAYNAASRYAGTVGATVVASKASSDENVKKVNSGNPKSGDALPVPGATPGEKTKGRTDQWVKPGGMPEADVDFDNYGPSNVRPLPGGGRVGVLPDGRIINVRPKSSAGKPTLEIQSGKNRIKVRYHDG